jgi:hypothetical protein
MADKFKALLKEAIWQLNGFVEEKKSEPVLTPEGESMLESAENFLIKARKSLKGVM